MSASTPHNYRPAPRPHLHHRQPRPRAPLNLPISLYADRFGIKSPGRSKSWLTPLDPLFPRNWENDQHGDSSKLLGDYQKSQLFCFTTRELKDLDAICDRPVKESTLTGGIMPLLRRDRWEDKPSTAWLRRESIPIFDALLLGPRRRVVESRYPPGSKIQKEFHTFHPRDEPWTFQRELEIAAERDRIFHGLMYEMDYMFTFSYSYENARDNDPPDNDPTFPVKSFGSSLGVTAINAWEMIVRKVPDAKWRLQTFINVGALEPILFHSDDLSDSERAAMIFRTATTVAHEVMHAISFYQALQRLGPQLFTNVREGYFEDEQLAELGWSWQWAIHGGIDGKKPSNSRTRRLLANFTERTFPSFTSKSFADSSHPVLIDPPISNYSDFYPIGVQFYEDVQNQDFWDLMVRGFGGRIFQYRTSKHGTRVTYDERRAQGGPFLVLKRDRLDPNLHAPYVAEDELLSSSIVGIKAQTTHTPTEKRLLGFVMKLVESARTGRDFWTTVDRQLQSVRDIIEILVRSYNNEQKGLDKDLGLLTTSIREVVELLVAAAANHEKMVGLLLERQRKHEDVEGGGVEGSGEDIFAKQALLAWNRGTRGFNREILDKFGAQFKFGELGRKLNVSYNILEKCQAVLFSPQPRGQGVSKYPLDQKEFDDLNEAATAIHAERDHVKGQYICHILGSDRFVGSFVKSGANLLTASSEVEKAGGVEKMRLAARRKSFLLAERGLQRLLWLSEEINHVSSGWESLFEEYITWGKEMVAKLNIRAREVLPDGNAQFAESMDVDRVLRRGATGGVSLKRPREQVEQMVEDEMEDVVFSDPKGTEESEILRQYKRQKMNMTPPGDMAPY
ncbi:hypothetical protein EYC84_002163 [Monilinia fructicola]|uniref:Uncharacterized protein n=1 Tax=Monilinia fructicola TaxID=38448 RepID=A0A5M9JMD3_MONFR|nr:hypothetical protein EYC84_002163 [Monilinia fructicola]